MIHPSRPPRLVVETREIDPIDDLILFAHPRSPLAWLRRSDGIIGLGGTLVGFESGGAGQRVGSGASGPSHADAWRTICAEAEIDDPIGLHGTGLVAFGALAFDSRSRSSSRLIVPHVVVGRRDGPLLDHPHPLCRDGIPDSRPAGDPLRPVLVGDARPRRPGPRGVPGRRARRPRRGCRR